MGADKLGHFFEEGLFYFMIAHTAGKTVADAIDAGHALEIGMQGLAATGVYSNADQAANLAGMQFYNDLSRNPNGLTFDIASYISDRWNEQTNPSFYAAAEGGIVWNNLLYRGVERCVFTHRPGTTPIDLTATLTVSSAGVVSGTYNWPATGPSISGTISNGSYHATNNACFRNETRRSDCFRRPCERHYDQLRLGRRPQEGQRNLDFRE